MVVEERFKIIGVMEDHPLQLNLETSDGIRHVTTRETYEVSFKKFLFSLEVPYEKGVNIPKDLFINFFAFLGPNLNRTS